MSSPFSLPLTTLHFALCSISVWLCNINSLVSSPLKHQNITISNIHFQLSPLTYPEKLISLSIITGKLTAVHWKISPESSYISKHNKQAPSVKKTSLVSAS